MGQAKVRGTYEERVSQAQATFSMEKMETYAHTINNFLKAATKGKVIIPGGKQTIAKRIIRWMEKQR
jgi:hypothetical protein